jgi:hypothetical protein
VLVIQRPKISATAATADGMNRKWNRAFERGRRISGTPTAGQLKQKSKEVLATCREEAKSQGLKGDARKTAVQDCFVKQRPDLAGWEKCRTAPEMKGKDKDERKALLKECLKANKS